MTVLATRPLRDNTASEHLEAMQAGASLFKRRAVQQVTSQGLLGVRALRRCGLLALGPRALESKRCQPHWLPILGWSIVPELVALGRASGSGHSRTFPRALL